MTRKLTRFTALDGTVDVKMFERALLQMPPVPSHVTLVAGADDAPGAQRAGAETESSP